MATHRLSKTVPPRRADRLKSTDFLLSPVFRLGRLRNAVYFACLSICRIDLMWSKGRAYSCVYRTEKDVNRTSGAA
eukprot:6192563-Pleurochrysis_carterae.AAC.5